MMNVELISANRLESHHVAAWTDVLRLQPSLDSPFFTPEFTQVVASVRKDVEVALLYDDGRLAGFFPFQRTRMNVAVPVGAGFSEFHGVIASPDLRWSAPELLRGCGLLAWKYDHVPVSQEPFARFHQRVGNSPFMNLTDGFGAYCAERQRSGSSVVRKTARKLRKLQRKVGQVCFELHDGGQRGLEKLIEWKSAQHARTGVIDVFRRGWVTDLLRRVHCHQDTDFSGVMSVLSVGGQPIAVHLGMRTGTVAHMWYPAFDTDFGEYSPGMILFLEMARELAKQGVVRIDLGPTPQRYKQSLRSGDIAVAIGTADRYLLAQLGRQAWQAGRRQVRASILAKPARVPARWLYRVRQWRAL
ncbi:MAG: GNAT family N-acetyltransferase [Pirellulaceae bacterium]|jgi:CelD/BcsL family acetyltransferase involved in cellulose biosynthesis|nr:GNAT family N-acetyltransferase [Pirellulaceae bacterium]